MMSMVQTWALLGRMTSYERRSLLGYEGTAVSLRRHTMYFVVVLHGTLMKNGCTYVKCNQTLVCGILCECICVCMHLGNSLLVVVVAMNRRWGNARYAPGGGGR